MQAHCAANVCISLKALHEILVTRRRGCKFASQLCFILQIELSRGNPMFPRPGFDVGGNNTVDVISRMYNELGITKHRWQSDGIKNCHVRFYPTTRMERVIRRRRGPKSFRNYVDKACFWTADDLHTIRKFMRYEI
ncbi:hypothetical protein HPB48_013156 [Haemaphysalis longicornis]|uniref:Uncharacterized protein n=1 Tax=Haemaphysalis longicornis TaxID=44386 RepID=A0A9J6FED4_HAELO|nr:hypothetical protein HPB48_013156 [Haemaphysalis longicornis]